MLDLSRVRAHFDAEKFDGEIAIVGLGAIGSRVSHLLNDVGLGEHLILYDGDHIERHNLASQAYRITDVGASKAATLALDLTHKWNAFEDELPRSKDGHTRAAPVAMTRYITPRDKLRHRIVVTCLDGMQKRRDVIGKSVFLNGATEFVMDARITATTVFAIGFDPRDPVQFRQYMDELYDDPTPEQNAAMGGCTITPSIAPTASIAASLLATLLIAHIKGEEHPNEVVVDLRNCTMQTRCYERTGQL